MELESLPLRRHSTTQSIVPATSLGADRFNSKPSGFSNSSVSTIYVTVSASPITETVYAIDATTLATKIDIAAGHDSLTKAEYPVSSLQVNEFAQAASHAGAYSFTEDNGTTSWMGASPPSSMSLITATSYVTLEPAQTLTTTAGTVLSTSRPYAKGYIPFGTTGWNATSSSSIALSVPSGSTGKGVNGSSYDDKLASQYLTSKSFPTSKPTSFAYRINRRQAGQIISATIDGVAVSWTNNYDGGERTTAPAVSEFTPVTATAPPFETVAPGKLYQRRTNVYVLT